MPSVFANLALQQAVRDLLADGTPRRRMDIWLALGGSPRVLRATLRQMEDELDIEEQGGGEWYRLRRTTRV